MPATLLVVPVGPTADELLPRLAALRAATRDREVEARVVDLWVDPERRARLAELVGGWARCELLAAGPCDPGEAPAVRALRAALPSSRAPLVVVADPRALVPEGGLARLRAHAERDPGVGLVAPLHLGPGADALPRAPGLGWRAVDAAARAAAPGRSAPLVAPPRAACLLVRRATLEDAGVERVADPEALVAWARASGWQAVVALDVVVDAGDDGDDGAAAAPPSQAVVSLRQALAVRTADEPWLGRAARALPRPAARVVLGALGRQTALRGPAPACTPRRADLERLRRPGVPTLNLLAPARGGAPTEEAADLAEALALRDLDVRLLGCAPLDPAPARGRALWPAVYPDAATLAAEAPDADAWVAVGHAAGAWLVRLARAGRGGRRALRLEDDDALVAPAAAPGRAALAAAAAAADLLVTPAEGVALAAAGLGAPVLVRAGARPDLFRPAARAAARAPTGRLRLLVYLAPRATDRGGAWALRRALAALAPGPRSALEVVASPEGAAALGDLVDRVEAPPGDGAARAAWVAGCDLFVDPEPRRAPARAAREALATGLACALADPGDPTLAGAALVVPARDPAALGAALARLAADAALRADLGASARAWAAAWTLDDEAGAWAAALARPGGERAG